MELAIGAGGKHDFHGGIPQESVTAYWPSWYQTPGPYGAKPQPIGYTRELLPLKTSCDRRSCWHRPLILNQRHPLPHHKSCPIKPDFVLGGGETKQVLEIGGITRTGRVYQPREMNEADEKKRKGKEILAEEPRERKELAMITMRSSLRL